MPGTLYVVATPIGNLDDISFRAIETLKSVDVIACENRQRHVKLLNHYQIKKRLIEYSPANERNSAKGILKLLLDGENVALVSDAGTPCLSDPGRVLVEMARDEEVAVLPIPGASALAALVSVSGFPATPLVFLGFLPKKPGKMKKELRRFEGIDCTIVLYCSSYQLKKTLNTVNEIYKNAEIIIGREISKANEEWIRGTAPELIERDITEKGEFSLAIKNFPKV